MEINTFLPGRDWVVLVHKAVEARRETLMKGDRITREDDAVSKRIRTVPEKQPMNLGPFDNRLDGSIGFVVYE